MAVNFTNIVGKLANMGFYDFVLPWLLFFAVSFGALSMVNAFGGKKNINAIIATVIAFFGVAFIPVGGIMAYYSTLFGVGGMVIAVLLLIIILGGVLGYKISDFEKMGGWVKPLIGLVIIALAVLAFSAATGGQIILPWLDSDTWTLIFIVVFVLLVIWYVDSGEGGGTPPSGHKPNE